MCPVERSALKRIYDAAKGREWTEDTKVDSDGIAVAWLDEYKSHCKWLGVSCDTSGHVIGLNLMNNALSGKLSESIGKLAFLEVLDVRDNNLKGYIPSQIGSLSNLRDLLLSYNGFIGEAPGELGELQNLERVHLHSNRIVGRIPPIKVLNATEFSFISDCGVPSAFNDPLQCDFCGMCCNLDEDCFPAKEKLFLRFKVRGADNYSEFLWVATLIFIGVCYLLWCLFYLIDRHKKCNTVSERRVSSVVRDEKYALETVGIESVYSFLLAESKLAWLIALGTIVLQVCVSDDLSDFIYTWKCPRDSLDCDDWGDLDSTGWAVFVLLMVAFLLKDLINGIKMIAYSAKERHTLRTKLRFFVGGVVLSMITIYIFWVSAIYNHAIATSNTEIIINSVAILFIMEIDECFYALIDGINKSWVDRVSGRDEHEQENDTELERLKLEVNELKGQVLEQLLIIHQLLEHSGIAQPQGEAPHVKDNSNKLSECY
ncbi:hypothetical protein THAOC_27192 [Thalassiosira oceanica]|uniref:Leucine-rich repeat-containing N-terminal plant-type domain-containing protein n=1 Tax=Thalassiosira oceanica TaxID=159749 RepID=K0S3A7_THAOC|nr:hypothetical protein THAOC_27192 [Thalassiosira oceanica]|eukprot:EJK53387.1 hypothetical protein THAOC_27192 [Thalassiosira oceanica]